MSRLVATFRGAVFLESDSALQDAQAKLIFLIRRGVKEHAILALLIHL